MKHFTVLAIVLVLGISAIYLSFNTSKLLLPSDAATGPVEQGDLGLTVDSETMSNGLTKVKAEWLNQPGDVMFYNIKIMKADGSRVAKGDPKNVGKVTSKTFDAEPLESGQYQVVLKAFYPNKIVEESFPFTVINPLNANLTTLIKNPGFENFTPNPAKPNDLDPNDWRISEGVMEIFTKAGGIIDETGNEKVEIPHIVQVVSEDGNFKAKQTRAVKINPGKGNKARVSQMYLTPALNLNQGTVIQRLSVFVPSQPGYEQRAELRKKEGGEFFGIRWAKNSDHPGNQPDITNPTTIICLRGEGTPEKPGSGHKDFCTNLPGLTENKWNNYEFRFEKLPDANNWKVTVSLDGKTILKTGKNGVPPVWVRDQIGMFFFGDECQGSTTCYDGFGTFYYDNADAFYIPANK